MKQFGTKKGPVSCKIIRKNLQMTGPAGNRFSV